ncbi:MAG TPA: hypothetical protein VJL80_04130, partial [Aeromicrobium sp.]
MAGKAIDEHDTTSFRQEAGLNFETRNHRLLDAVDGGGQYGGCLAGLSLQKALLGVFVGPHR